jgi:hypothetical protein
VGQVDQASSIAREGRVSSHPLQDFKLALGSDLAGKALSARFFGKEVPYTQKDIGQIAAIINHSDHPGAQCQTCRAQVFKGQAHIQVLFNGETARCPAKKGGLELSAWSQAAGQVVQQMADGDPKGNFIQAWALNIAGNTE